jgi:hypothetical protein
VLSLPLMLMVLMFTPAIKPPPKRGAKSGENVTNESKNRNISRLSVIQKLV